jgi:hypothetical protein
VAVHTYSYSCVPEHAGAGSGAKFSASGAPSASSKARKALRCAACICPKRIRAARDHCTIKGANRWQVRRLLAPIKSSSNSSVMTSNDSAARQVSYSRTLFPFNAGRAECSRNRPLFRSIVTISIHCHYFDPLSLFRSIVTISIHFASRLQVAVRWEP